MTNKKDKNLVGYDPLAWMDEDNEQENPVSHSAQPAAAAEPVNTAPSEEVTNDASDTGEQQENILCLEQTLNIQNVVHLHEQLMTMFDNYNHIEIDASNVTTIDTANLQLLIIFKQGAIKLHKDVVINSPSSRFKEAADLLGIAEMLDVAG
jgi:ABC-type transporter Mla MlaB component